MPCSSACSPPNLRGNFRLGALVALTAVANSLLTQVMAASWAMITSTLLGAFIGTFFIDPTEKEAARDE